MNLILIRRLRTIKRRTIVVLCSSLIGIYCVSYVVLSRLNKIDATWGRRDYFSYVPARFYQNKDLSPAARRIARRVNDCLILFYYPIWTVDRHLFKGPVWVYPPQEMDEG